MQLIKTHRNNLKNWILWKLGYLKKYDSVILPSLSTLDEAIAMAEKHDIIWCGNDPLDPKECEKLLKHF